MSRTPGAAIRRRIPIAAYVGGNGDGKTLCMVYDTLATLDGNKRRKVLSTVRLLDDNGNPHPNFEPLTDWRDILYAKNCDILLDEVTGVASSRDFAALPAQLGNRMMQLRKAGCIIRWSTPNFARADVMLREVTRGVTVCKGYFREFIRDENGELIDPFGSSRVFHWVTYNGEDFDNFEASQTEKLKVRARQWVYRSPKFAAAARYDTHEECLVLSHLDLTGSCTTCGGHRTKPKCSCPRPELPHYERRDDDSSPAGDGHQRPRDLVAITTSSGTRLVEVDNYDEQRRWIA